MKQQGIVIYMDEIMIPGQTNEESIENLRIYEKDSDANTHGCFNLWLWCRVTSESKKTTPA